MKISERREKGSPMNTWKTANAGVGPEPPCARDDVGGWAW